MNILHGYTHQLIFGKYKGKTLQWCLTNDPSYIIWLNDTVDNFFVKPDLLKEATDKMLDTKTSVTYKNHWTQSDEGNSNEADDWDREHGYHDLNDNY